MIVVTGRGTDPGLVLGPLIHEFGWVQDWDRLAAGTIAGHIVECGAQCTGGNYTDWRDVPDLAMVGTVWRSSRAGTSWSPSTRTGGRVSVETVTHQLAYEWATRAGT